MCLFSFPHMANKDVSEQCNYVFDILGWSRAPGLASVDLGQRCITPVNHRAAVLPSLLLRSAHEARALA